MLSKKGNPRSEPFIHCLSKVNSDYCSNQKEKKTDTNILKDRGSEIGGSVVQSYLINYHKTKAIMRKKIKLRGNIIYLDR